MYKERIYIYIERERDIIRFCVCKIPAAAHGLKRYKAKSFGQTIYEPQTDGLTGWFIVLHFAAKNRQTKKDTKR